MQTFNLPDLGEGLPDAEIVEWHVKEGDIVEVDQPLVSMETAKAIVEVPSPNSGKITKLYGQKGDTIDTGSPLVEFEMAKREDTGTVVGKVEVGTEVVAEKPLQVSDRAGGIKVLPAIRALAKKLNVDLTTVAPTGPDGTITQQDVKQAHAALADAGPIEPLKGVRKMMAMAMQQSHAEVVPVSIFDDADITDWANTKDYTVRLLQAIVEGCQQEPSLNAWYDGKAMGRRLLKNVHIGVAMDTDDGLFVPVIQDAQEQTADGLRATLETLKQEVQARTIAQDKLKGNTITLSNFGKFAGRYANPIVVPPSVAILGVGAVRQEIRPIDGKPMVRKILPLSLTFDHRAVTGGEATRFLGVILNHLKQSEV